MRRLVASLLNLVRRARANVAARRRLKDEQRLEDDFGDFPGADD